MDAQDINVKDFRLLYQWPLIAVPDHHETTQKAIGDCIQETKVSLENGKSGWSRVDPLDYPPADKQKTGESNLCPAYGEFLYFHDFVQKFLFPRMDEKNPSFTLFKSERFDKVTCMVTADLTLDFKVLRHSLHLFSSGVAIVSFELAFQSRHEGRLTLGDAMQTMNLLRRSYVPYFVGGTAGEVPKMVCLRGGKNLSSFPPTEQEAHEFLSPGKRSNPNLRPGILKHWAALAKPLTLLGEGGRWRDLSDERLPFNAYISLSDYDFPLLSYEEAQELPEEKKLGYQTKVIEADRTALLQIDKGDWMRLAEVDGPGDAAFAYNPDFLAKGVESHAFYDRFFPHEKSGDNSTRHIFSAAHYCTVGAGWFFDNLVRNVHWRRHYAQLTLIARFEQASLLAISSRLSQIARNNDPDSYENDLLDMQKQFAHFEHRYRFTGISSQIQPSEMFAHLRRVMGLDALYEDVKNEIEQGAARVRALQQGRSADAATRLNQIASIGLFIALVASFAGMNLFIDADYLRVSDVDWRDDLMRFSLVVFGTTVMFGVLLWSIPRNNGSGFLRQFSHHLMIAALVSAALAIVLYLAG